MRTSDDLTDEELTAYLDGEADAELAARVERAEATDPSVARRLRALDIDIPALRTAADDLLAQAPAPSLAPAPSPVPVKAANDNVWMKLAAALVVGIVIGAGVFGAVAPGSDLDDWADYVAAYHVLYVPETLTDVEQSDGFSADQLARVGDGVGLDLSAVPEATTLSFRRAQILGLDSAPIAQLAYLAEDGTPVAFCMTKGDGTSADFSEGTRLGLRTVEWSDGTHKFLLIGDIGEGTILDAARELAGLV